MPQVTQFAGSLGLALPVYLWTYLVDQSVEEHGPILLMIWSIFWWDTRGSWAVRLLLSVPRPLATRCISNCWFWDRPNQCLRLLTFPCIRWSSWFFLQGKCKVAWLWIFDQEKDRLCRSVGCRVLKVEEESFFDRNWQFVCTWLKIKERISDRPSGRNCEDPVWECSCW